MGTADFESVEKRPYEKSYQRKRDIKWSNCVQNCRPITFYWVELFYMFLTDSKSASNSAFFGTHVKYLYKTNLFCFLQSLKSSAYVKAKKTSFINMTMASNSGLGGLVLSKKVTHSYLYRDFFLKVLSSEMDPAEIRLIR
jgi:hypothetical protein